MGNGASVVMAMSARDDPVRVIPSDERFKMAMKVRLMIMAIIVVITAAFVAVMWIIPANVPSTSDAFGVLIAVVVVVAVILVVLAVLGCCCCGDRASDEGLVDGAA